MERNETLTDKQSEAIALLVTGHGITETAQKVGVGRTTLWRWMRKDLAFRAELNRQRNALRETLADRLHGLTDQALSTVEHAVGDGNVRAALAVLKGSGLLDGRWPVLTESVADLSLLESLRLLDSMPRLNDSEGPG